MKYPTIFLLLIYALLSLPNKGYASQKDTVVSIDTVVTSKDKDTLKVKKYFLNDSLVLMESYYMSGVRESIYPYRNGLLNGEVREWDKDGDLVYKVTKKNGENTGELRYWYPGGELKAKGYFVNNKGIVETFYRNGNTKSYAVMSGKEEYIGLFQAFYRNGNIKYVRDYGKDVQDFRSYYENGRLKKEGILKDDYQPIGKWRYFERDGDLKKEEIYREGKLVKTKKY